MVYKNSQNELDAEVLELIQNNRPLRKSLIEIFEGDAPMIINTSLESIDLVRLLVQSDFKMDKLPEDVQEVTHMVEISTRNLSIEKILDPLVKYGILDVESEKISKCATVLTYSLTEKSKNQRKALEDACAFAIVPDNSVRMFEIYIDTITTYGGMDGILLVDNGEIKMLAYDHNPEGKDRIVGFGFPEECIDLVDITSEGIVSDRCTINYMYEGKKRFRLHAQILEKHGLMPEPREN